MANLLIDWIISWSEVVIIIITFFLWEVCIYTYNNIIMKHGISRQRLDPVLAPDQFGIYPSFPALTGVPWSEYVRSQMNRSRSVSSMEALDSDLARYITSRITQYPRSMATSTRSLPTDLPFPTFINLKWDMYCRVYLVT